MPTPIPLESAPARRSLGVAAYPLLIGLSVGAHAVVIVALGLLPIPAMVRAEPVPIPFVLVGPDSEPEPVAEPEPPPPAPVEARVAALAPAPPRRRPRPAAPVDPEPAPPASVMTTTTPGTSDWAQDPGVPEGQHGGVPGGTGMGLPSDAPASGPIGEQPQSGISRAALRRMLAGYIRDTLSRFLDGRIDYPLAARREHLEGVVVLRVRLSRDGRILGVRLSQSSGHPMLDQAAQASVSGLGSMPAPPAQIPWDDARELPLPVTYVLR
ncbi:MAG: energy transducer TonB [Sandaracinaceae bacterium]|nr:energy transducer TonB [Sandaracinaceae bacterium]